MGTFNYEIKKVKNISEVPAENKFILIKLNTSNSVPDIKIEGDVITLSLVESIHDSMAFQFYALYNDTLTKLAKNKNFNICRDAVIFDEDDSIDMSIVKAISRTYLMMIKPYCDMDEDEAINIYIAKENNIDKFFTLESDKAAKKEVKKDKKKNKKKNKKKGK